MKKNDLIKYCNTKELSHHNIHKNHIQLNYVKKTYLLRVGDSSRITFMEKKNYNNKLQIKINTFTCR